MFAYIYLCVCLLFVITCGLSCCVSGVTVFCLKFCIVDCKFEFGGLHFLKYFFVYANFMLYVYCLVFRLTYLELNFDPDQVVYVVYKFVCLFIASCNLFAKLY